MSGLLEFLGGFCDLHDCAYITELGWDRFSGPELAAFRNGDTPVGRDGRAVDRDQRRLTAAELAKHRARQILIRFTQDGSSGRYLLSVDIDNKLGTGDADRAARYLSDAYLLGRTHIEPSTGGLGRHCYFILAAPGIDPADICRLLDALTARLRDDQRWQALGVTMDKVIGKPIVWARAEDGRWRAAKRGDAQNVPRCPGGESDVRALCALAPVPLEHLAALIGADDAGSEKRISFPRIDTTCDTSGKTGSKRRAAGTGGMGAPAPTSTNPDGAARRYACWWATMNATGGRATVDEIVGTYKAGYLHQGLVTEADERRWRQDFAAIDRKCRPDFRPAERWTHPHALYQGQYLELVSRVVPAAALTWPMFRGKAQRRETLTHERLADFLGVMLEAAFMPKASHYWFGATSRDATIRRIRKLRKNKVATRSINEHVHGRLLEICCEHGLLEEFAPFIPPRPKAKGRGRIKGRGRVIGPGLALPQERTEWLALYERARRAVQTQQAAEEQQPPRPRLELAQPRLDRPQAEQAHGDQQTDEG